jgi:hypothetical protein
MSAGQGEAGRPPENDAQNTNVGQASMNTEVPGPAKRQAGKIGYILLWLLGVPIPILIVIFLLRGCN